MRDMSVNTLRSPNIEPRAPTRRTDANVRAPLVPTLPTLSVVLSEEEREERLAYWIQDAMARRGLTPPRLAVLVGVSRSAVLAWTKGPTVKGSSVPSMIHLGPLAAALRVDPRLFADLPPIPPSGAAEYLVEAAESGVDEGLRRGRARPTQLDSGKPARSPRPRAPRTEAKPQ